MLRAAGKSVYELSGIMPNPRTEKVYEGIELCRKHKIDLILAVGGGSTIDCSKAIAVGAPAEGDFWEKFYVNWESAETGIPLGVILTIPATGSELDKSAVITNFAPDGALYLPAGRRFSHGQSRRGRHAHGDRRGAAIHRGTHGL